MCYLAHERQAGASEGGGARTPPSLDRLRPRWAGAVAAALIGGFAVAAMVAPSSTSPLLSAKESSAPAPVAMRAAAVPAADMVRQGSGSGSGSGSTPVDDGVPSAPDVVKAGMGHCDHGL